MSNFNPAFSYTLSALYGLPVYLLAEQLHI